MLYFAPYAPLRAMPVLRFTGERHGDGNFVTTAFLAIAATAAAITLNAENPTEALVKGAIATAAVTASAATATTSKSSGRDAEADQSSGKVSSPEEPEN